jgi:bifunctional ADP-heptose synthase (sugar kinase/adenylyltransferase)
MSLICGAQAKEIAVIANLAAGIEVSKFGAFPVGYEELLQVVRDEERG